MIHVKIDSYLYLKDLFENDNISVTQLDNLLTQDLIKVDVPTRGTERFNSVYIITDNDLSKMKTERIPKHTRRQNCWAMSCYLD